MIYIVTMYTKYGRTNSLCTTDLDLAIKYFVDYYRTDNPTKQTIEVWMNNKFISSFDLDTELLCSIKILSYDDIKNTFIKDLNYFNKGLFIE